MFLFLIMKLNIKLKIYYMKKLKIMCLIKNNIYIQNFGYKKFIYQFLDLIKKKLKQQNS